MPMTYSIDSTRLAISTTASGVLTDQDILAHKNKLLSDPDLKPGMVELMNLQGITKAEVTPDGIKRLAVLDDSDKEALGDFKLAIVVSQDLMFGMARIFEALTTEGPPSVFVSKDVDSAKSWLGIS